ncbi:MAG: tetratricopeptide repeat protein [Planctomycetes bacterium]|nr:tetratricopeptide repeat protein [Planctomycetota bacterium]
MGIRTLALSLVLCGSGMAQQGAAAPDTTSQDKAGAGALRRTFVEPAVDRATLQLAAAHVGRSGAEGRARFMAMLRDFAAHAPRPADTPAGAGESAAAAELPAETSSCMTDAVTGTPEQRREALAKLGRQDAVGRQALARLHERGTAILQRCLWSFVRTKLATNAIYAGQFDELRDYQPEAAAVLLEWSRTPPKEASPPGPFRAACVRALRDVLPGEQPAALRRNLSRLALQAQREGDEDLFVTTACALHQFGDPALFDQRRAEAERQAQTEDPQQRLAATNTLAALHYQLRQYEVAATHFQRAVEQLEQADPKSLSLANSCYNAACALALAGRTDDAFAFLDRALRHGSASHQLSKAMLDEDHDTRSLKADPRFAQILQRYFGPHGEPR